MAIIVGGIVDRMNWREADNADKERAEQDCENERKCP